MTEETGPEGGHRGFLWRDLSKGPESWETGRGSQRGR